jgi:hypothetical protein
MSKPLNPGDVMLHEQGRCAGVVGPDGLLYTHNMVLDAHQARRFRTVAPDDVPAHLRGYLDAARTAADWRTTEEAENTSARAMH